MIPPEIAAEITGPIPALGDEPTAPAPGDNELGVDQADTELPAVTPQAPLDVRLLETLGEFLAARPRWSQRQPSTAEAFEYSTSGDWTANEKSAKRIFHGLCVLIAFVVTYPFDWAVQAARQKPVGFVLAIALLFVLGKVL